MSELNDSRLSIEENKSIQPKTPSNRNAIIVALFFGALFVFIIFYEIYMNKF